MIAFDTFIRILQIIVLDDANIIMIYKLTDLADFTESTNKTDINNTTSIILMIKNFLNLAI